MSSVYGENIRLSIFGQSHSDYIGVVIDGLEAGLEIDFDELAAFMLRRSPSSSPASTARSEADKITVASGIFGGYTCGAPLCMLIKNSDARPSDYDKIKSIPRPSHADFCAYMKTNGYNDYRGGGHLSGRLTAPLCAAGGIFIQLLRREGIKIAAHILSVGQVSDRRFDMLDPNMTVASRAFPTLDRRSGEDMQCLIAQVRERGDSVGGEIECAVTGLPIGLGEPIFGGIENEISRAVFAIPAVKGIEFGDTALYGSENNDPFIADGGEIHPQTNRAGGILGGMASGLPVIFRTKIKPAPSIAIKQKSADMKSGKNAELKIEGRHDCCIIPRALPCIEAATAIAVYELIRSRR